ncbi:antitoxin [Amycolatopsis sp. FDAARGOS 1241]|uniref:antitoxin n=1 Tax=Amycolatopsis sp. FDAARGOS 1241 TaxID=2778070 RepID=UPI001950D664|nr:antitoxin [Amycolatopsis sp. FDAARGOS 1241]QRP45688.1 antitoxin [Amycolatopsis sp. FDAARGOS 1241]
MGINFDELKNKAADALRDNSGKIEDGLDKAAGFAKSKIHGHDSQIDGGVEKAKDFLGKLAGKPDEDGEQPPQQQ